MTISEHRMKSTTSSGAQHKANSNISHNKHVVSGNVQSTVTTTDLKSLMHKVPTMSVTGTGLSRQNGVHSTEQSQTSQSKETVTQSEDKQADIVYSEGDVFKDPIEPTKLPTFFSSMKKR